MRKNIRKVIIPVAGLGTRLLPVTKAIPKEMLPLVDKPLIHYIMDECQLAGIHEIILVTHWSKEAIENYFDTNFELEVLLEDKGKQELLHEIRNVCSERMSITHVRQGVAKGLGHAILKAKHLIGDEGFVVILPDVIINSYHSNLKQDNLSEMLRRYQATGYSQIMVETVEKDLVSNYGIVDCSKQSLLNGENAQIKSVIEKPTVTDAPSDLAIVGRYVFSNKIWPLLEKTEPGVAGEIQLTDAIAELIEQEVVEAYLIKGRSHDCGHKLGYIKTFIEYAMEHPQLSKPLTEWLQQRVHK